MQDTITGSIDLVPSSTISLTSLNTTIAQIVCVGDTIDNIVYGIGGGATGATISGNPSGTTGGYAGGIFTISGIPTTAVSVTTIYTYTISSTGNIGCVETSVQGTIKVVPNIIIDEVGIAGLITHITCENADDGRIGHPTTEPLDAFVTGGLTNIAQVDRIYLNQDLSSVNPVAPSIGDIFTVTINSNSYTHTVVGISGGLTGPAQTVTQTAKFLGDLINTGETSLTAQANIFGDGTINLMANTPGIGFSASVIKQVPKVLRITVTGSVDTNHVSITIGSTVYGYTVNGTGLAKVASDIVSATSPSTIVSATANGDGTVNLVGNVVGNDYIFSRTVSGVTIFSTTDISTQFEISNLVGNFSSNYTYSWAMTGNAAFTSNNLEIIGLAPGDYTLTVGVNGSTSCEVTTNAFTIIEPSLVIGTVSQTCGGDITVNVTGGLTPTQLAGILPILSITIYEKSLGSTPVYTQVGLAQTYNITSSSTVSWTVPFNNLSEGREYLVEIIDNTCGTPTTQLIGPINETITIDESASNFWATAQVCLGQNDGTIVIPVGLITGGSGSYLYQWTDLTNSATYITKDLLGVPPGFFTLTVTDQLITGCTATLITDIEVEAAGATLLSTPDPLNDLSNECFFQTDNTITIVPSGGGGTYQYLWYFTPATTSTTLLLANITNSMVAAAEPQITSQPRGSAGTYSVEVYDGLISSGCPGVISSFVITGPSPMSFTSSNSQVNIVCAGETTGSFTFGASGGTPPYFYTTNGGIPSTPTLGTETVSGLAAGTYDLIIKDSSLPSCGTPNTVTRQIIITEPAGGPLALTEGTITEVPCTGGLGSFVVNVTGGAAKTVSGTVVATLYQVRVVGPGSSYILNTTHDRSESSFLVDNLVSIGNYTVTVTDSNGCVQTIIVDLPTSAPDNLGATATIVGGTDCSAASFNDGNTGFSIKIGPFDKGDGDIAGYPLWERRTSQDLDQFTIALNGTVTGVDLSTLGVNITSGSPDTINASAAGSTTIVGVQDVAAILASKINVLPNYSATLNGSMITVSGQIIDAVSTFTVTGTTLNISVSGISKTSITSWVEVPGLAGQEVIDDLAAGYYRGILRDGSGCGGVLVENLTQGGNIFQIDDPQALQYKDITFDEITCKVPTSTLKFKLSNGTYNLIPDPSAFELTLNSSVLVSTVAGSIKNITTGTTTTVTVTPTTTTPTTAVAAVVGNSYTPNLNTNTILIDNIIPGDYELVVKNIQTQCIAVLNFTVEEQPGITYSGDTDFVIDPCFETYQESFFDQLLIDGGTPFTNLDGESFYNLKWTFYPEDITQGVATINSLSNNVNFNPSPGRYELMIIDFNGCTLLDEAGNETPIEFTFTRQLGELVITGTGGATGDQFSQPVSCEIDSKDGQINLAVAAADPTEAISPYEITWDILAPANTAFEQRLLFQGVKASDSLEVYTIKLNDQPISYITQVQDEPIASVVNELIQIIDQTTQFVAKINTATPNEIIITTASQAALTLEIVSRSSRLQMVNSSSNVATWLPLDGTNGNQNYTGYLDLNNLSEGLYRYTITSIDVSACVNTTQPNSIVGVITIENENVLEIREGPIVDEFLCNGQSGDIFIDVFDGNTGPLTFFYNGAPVTFDKEGTQYTVNIDNPVEIASFEIYNAANCGISREIRIGNGNPQYDFTSSNFELSASFLAREDITFVDLSENDYDTFKFLFGDGTETERIERNTPDPIYHEYAISGTYLTKLRIFNAIGCVEELTKNIRIGKGYSILVPNVFTPNGDIYNATFRPIFNGLSEVFFRVYDSTGGLVYQEEGEVGKDPDLPGVSLIGWSGLDTSSFAPYYIYTITGKTIDDEDVFRDGTFIILN